MIPPAALSIASRIGWRGGVIIALAGFGAVQTVRVELKNSALEACEARKAVLSAEIDQMQAAQAEANKRAVAARMAEQRRFQELAEKADYELEQARRDALADARAYIERMRPESRIRGGGAVAAPGDRPAESSDGPDPAPLVDEPVIVEAADVLICTDTVLRLEAVQEWAAGLNQ